MTEILKNAIQKEGVWHSDALNEISYPEHGSEFCFQVEDNSYWFKHRNQVILNYANRYLSENNSFLDVGGGNGFVSRELQNNGYEVVMLEPYLQGCLNAKKRKIKNIINGDFQTVSLKSESFDAIGMFDVLEHIENRVEFLKHAAKNLKPGGYIFITVPAYKTLWSKEDDYAGHYTRYTHRSLRKDLSDAGFKVERADVFFWILWPAILIFRTIPSLLGMQLNSDSDHKFPVWLEQLLKIEKIWLNKNIFQPMGTSLIVAGKKE